MSHSMEVALVKSVKLSKSTKYCHVTLNKVTKPVVGGRGWWSGDKKVPKGPIFHACIGPRSIIHKKDPPPKILATGLVTASVSVTTGV